MTKTGIVLAGGAGRRMEGAYKPLVEFRGRPLILRPLETLARRCEEVLIAHGVALDARLAVVVGTRARFVADDGSGPLAGLHAAAERASGDWLLVAPCDAPFITPQMYDELLAAAGRRDGACFAADGVPNPLVAALRREKALDAFDDARFRGKRAPRDAYALMDVVLVSGAAADLFDLDTPDDVRRAGG